MWPYHPELLETPVPRYTSFPTAAEFTEAIGPAHFAEALATATQDISLYLHVPFCRTICWYCGCNTGAANRAARLTRYLDAVHREVAMVAALLPASARVRRIAFGGGSPNAIAPMDFVRLMDALVLHLPLDNPLISIELDPRTMQPDWGAVLAGIGATQASLGVQTFDPLLQRAIGRVQPLAMIERSVDILRAAGVSSLNFDLMYGLPGQTQAELEATLNQTVRLGANRVALFGYAHVPHLVPRQQKIDATLLPDGRNRFHMAERGNLQLIEAGYDAVGFDHFALPGDPLAQAACSGRLRRNFQGFTDDQAPVVIGLGASAISSFPTLLCQNEKNAGRYRALLDRRVLPTTKGVARSAQDQRRGAVVESLLCRGYARVEQAMLLQAGDRLMPYARAGLCEMDDGALVIEPHALPYARSIAACFDPYRQAAPRRFSSAI